MVSEIKICMGSACFAKGNQDNLVFIKNYIEEHCLESEIHLIGGLCENQCANGPRIIVDDVAYNNVTKEKILEILKG